MEIESGGYSLGFKFEVNFIVHYNLDPHHQKTCSNSRSVHPSKNYRNSRSTPRSVYLLKQKTTLLLPIEINTPSLPHPHRSTSSKLSNSYMKKDYLLSICRSKMNMNEL